MFTGNLVSYSQQDCSGVTVNVLTLVRPDTKQTSPPKPDGLEIPWHKLKANSGDNPLPMLQWQSRLSSFVGRDDEMRQLREWAEGPDDISIKFLWGPGGVGKSRLAAEFADRLDIEGWRAGFVYLSRDGAYICGDSGSLMIIDYPEEHRDIVLGLLEDLAHAGQRLRLRVLMLTRTPIAQWKDIISDTRSRRLVDWEEIALDGLPVGSTSAYEIVESSLREASKHKGSTPPARYTSDLKDLMAGRDEHTRPLFLVAAGIHSALHPEARDVRYTGPEVMEALVEWERTRLRRTAKGLGLVNPDSLALAVTYATLRKSVPLNELEDDNDLCGLLGLTEDKPWRDALVKSGHVQGEILRNLEPDIIGADFVHTTLADNRKLAPALVFAAAGRDPIAAIGTFGRLIYDAQVTLGRTAPHVQDWLHVELTNNSSAWMPLSEWSSLGKLPHFLTPCVIEIEINQLKNAQDEPTVARLLNNLSNRYGEIGQREQALKVSQQAVKLCRKLAGQNQTAFDEVLAGSLNNLSSCLSDLDHHEKALEVNQQAVGLFRKLAEQNSVAFEPDLAISLNNLSGCLSQVGQREKALEAIQEAVTIRRRLAEQNPAAFEPDLAMSLNNLSIHFLGLGQHKKALEAAQETVSLRRKQAEQNPAAFEPNLAMSLGTMTQILNASSEHEKALQAIQEANTLFRKYAEHNFLRGGRYAALTFQVKAETLTALNRPDEAAAALAEAEEVERRLEEAREAARKQAEG